MTTLDLILQLAPQVPALIGSVVAAVNAIQAKRTSRKTFDLADRFDGQLSDVLNRFAVPDRGEAAKKSLSEKIADASTSIAELKKAYHDYYVMPVEGDETNESEQAGEPDARSAKSGSADNPAS